MLNQSLASIVLFASIAPAALAQSIEFLPQNYFASDLSYDGSIATGNLIGPYETFRWTINGGVELLGGATVPSLGVGAGTPDISDDGTRISATILDDTEMFATMGIWTIGLGWDSVVEADNPNVVNIDSNLSSAWGLSGDGTTICGYYYRSASGSFGRAQPCTWSQANGLVALEVDEGRNSRVNAVNFDGSIACGWEERPDGAWQPTVWRNGVKMRLSPNEAFTTCEGISSDGNVVVGQSFMVSSQNRIAAIWRWDGTQYIEQSLPLLPGTPAFQGWAVATGVSDDGTVVVGTNLYSQSPGGPADGIVWTEQTGLVKALDYFNGLGFDIATTIDILGMVTVSPDASTFVAEYYDSRTNRVGSMILSLPNPCQADLNKDGNLDFFDVSIFLSQFTSGDLSVDFNDSGNLDFFDVSVFLSLFSQGCPA